MKNSQVGDLEMATNIDLIATTTHLPFEREKQSKNCSPCDIPSKKLIVNNFCGYHVKGMEISSPKSKWHNLVVFFISVLLVKGETY